MNKSIFKKVSKIILAIIQSKLLILFIRGIIVFIIFLYIVPKFYPSLLKDFITKVEVSILTVILLEFIILKMSLISKKEDIQEENNKDEEKNIDQKFFSSKLEHIIKNRQCFLFLHTNSVSMNELLSKQNYSKVNIDLFQDKKIKLFDNFYNVIIGCEVNTLKEMIVNDEDKYRLNDLIRCFRNNKSNNITLIITVKDLIGIKEDLDNLYRNFYTVIQYISNKLNRQYNINILIDQIGQIKGFENFLNMSKNSPQSMFGMSFICSINKKNVMIKYLEKEFKQFLINLESYLYNCVNQNIAEYQDAYYFITQIRELYVYIERIIECVVMPTKKWYFWKRNKKVLLGVYFINSSFKEFVLSPIIMDKFSDNIEIIERENDE